MTTTERYVSAKEIFAAIGVDTDAALEILKRVPVSMHCWQGDDVTGFDHDGPLTGGIQTTGDYPGKARTSEELMADMDKAISLIPGKRKLTYMRAMRFLRKGNMQTVTGWSRSILRDGLRLRRKKAWDWISTLLFSRIRW